MGLSKQYLSRNGEEVSFDPAILAAQLTDHLPEASFGFLLGSAVGGTVPAGSDLDLAFYLTEAPTLDLYTRVEEAVAKLLPAVRCDVGILNDADPVFRFEALKGRLLFARDREQYALFFSRTCREYERQMIDYERQRRYRVEFSHAL